MDPREHLVDVEKKRLQLEKNVANLRASLRHWQQWEIEYESMKEDLVALGDNALAKDLAEVENGGGESLSGKVETTLLDSKERRLLLYEDEGSLRKIQKVIGLLSRRTDYVDRNIKSVLSLLESAEQNLRRFDSSAETESQQDEKLPLTDIYEELDDDGNVISSSTSHPSDKANQLTEMLETDGNEGSKALAADRTPQPSSTHQTTSPSQLKATTPPGSSPLLLEEDVDEIGLRDSDMSWSDSSVSSSPTRQRVPKLRKRVSFAEGTKPEDDPLEHPRALEKSEQMRLLKEVFAQVRQEMARSIVAKNLAVALPDGVSPRWSLPEECEGDYALPVLKMSRNRKAKRLLKSYQLSLWEASRVLYKMAETNNYDLDSPEITNAILQTRESLGRKPKSSKNGTKGATTKAAKSTEAARDLVPAESESRMISVGQKGSSNVTAVENGHLINGNAAAFHPASAFELHGGDDISSDSTTLTSPGIDIAKRKQSSANEKGYIQSPASGPNYSKPVSNGVSRSMDWTSASDGRTASPIIPHDESSEDAALRQQMLRYNMKEVGAVVAELNVDDNDTDDDMDDDYEIDADAQMNIYGSDEEEDDDEDEHGRTLSHVLTGDYLAEMKALEERLKAGTMVNLGQSADDQKILTTFASNAAPMNGESQATTATLQASPNGATKAVRFADELSIQEAPVADSTTSSKVPQNFAGLVERPIVERKTPDQVKPPMAPQTRPSRFKVNRQNEIAKKKKQNKGSDSIASSPPIKRQNPATAPIVERPFNPTTSKPIAPTKPDDLDSEYLQRQVHDEYQRLRSRMIPIENGSRIVDESAETVNGAANSSTGGRKMSRFQAARLGLR
ncbi:uncharacterized protein KY384_001997 [Bacidia gigantensis]|uniref:uncharacterized protein n=1 Tax=Bacidia gigantensis TaxID=2732470 RepID=UPI001D0518DC|nr:uncharacterized protein KY384_001997 [Bacidia gigantensis]KAG8533214.1 hypothetical protein KY384_001997 [Bacidia gigantensis]